jgi:2-methylcitrate dehydratase PrpD
MNRRTFLTSLSAAGCGVSVLEAYPRVASGMAMPGLQEEPSAPPSPLIRELTAYMATAVDRPLPAAVVEKTKQHILDTLGAMVSGMTLLPGKIAASYVQREGGAPDACVVGTRILTTATNAALANGMSAHADETDDSHQPAYWHPGAAIVPAALAMSERQGRSGEAFLRAVTLGYDIGARFNYALGVMDFHRAGHSTHSFGTLFGAAAAAGAMARLSADQSRHLLSYAAQQASGVSTWARDTDHIEKSFDFGGMPARGGVAAASMVAHGMTGVDDVLAGDRNFLFAFGAEGRAQRLTQGLGSTYEILQTNVKYWSVGSPIQAPLSSLQTLLGQHQFTANDVTHVRVEVADNANSNVDNREMPDICLQHLVAVMLIDRNVTFVSSHDLDRMRDPAVLAVRKRVELIGTPELTKAVGRQAIVTVTLRDGRVLRHHTQAVKGTAQNPMTSAEIADKGMDLMAPTLGADRAKRLIDSIWRLESVADVRSLRPLLQNPAA